MKIIDKLSTYASLIGVSGAIGGGFYEGLSEIKESLSNIKKDVEIVKKENELQDSKIEAVRLKTVNPLAN